MTTFADGAPPSVNPESDDDSVPHRAGVPGTGGGPAGDAATTADESTPEGDRRRNADPDTGSSWLLEEIQRRIAEGSSGSGGRHARRGTPSASASAGYVPRHSVATPGPGAPRPAPVGGQMSQASELLRRERTEGARTAWSRPSGSAAPEQPPGPSGAADPAPRPAGPGSAAAAAMRGAARGRARAAAGAPPHPPADTDPQAADPTAAPSPRPAAPQPAAPRPGGPGGPGAGGTTPAGSAPGAGSATTGAAHPGPRGAAPGAAGATPRAAAPAGRGTATRAPAPAAPNSTSGSPAAGAPAAGAQGTAAGAPDTAAADAPAPPAGAAATAAPAPAFPATSGTDPAATAPTRVRPAPVARPAPQRTATDPSGDPADGRAGATGAGTVAPVADGPTATGARTPLPPSAPDAEAAAPHPGPAPRSGGAAQAPPPPGPAGGAGQPHGEVELATSVDGQASGGLRGRPADGGAPASGPTGIAPAAAPPAPGAPAGPSAGAAATGSEATEAIPAAPSPDGRVPADTEATGRLPRVVPAVGGATRAGSEEPEVEGTTADSPTGGVVVPEPRAPEQPDPEPRGARLPRPDDPDDPDHQASKRVRVVLAERKGVARPVRTVVDIQEGTGVGELLRTNLIGSQLAVALRFAIGAGLTLGLLPLLFAMVPEVGRIEVLGLRLPWLLLGVLVYPFLFGLGLWHTRTAEHVEQNFADHVQD